MGMGIEDLEWAAKLRLRFGDARPTDAEWVAIKQKLPIGSEVSGRVVAAAAFGVWMDIGVQFPALLEVPQLDDFWHDRYPPEGEMLAAKVLDFRESGRQVYLTQRFVPR